MPVEAHICRGRVCTCFAHAGQATNGIAEFDLISKDDTCADVRILAGPGAHAIRRTQNECPRRLVTSTCRLLPVPAEKHKSSSASQSPGRLPHKNNCVSLPFPFPKKTAVARGQHWSPSRFATEGRAPARFASIGGLSVQLNCDRMLHGGGLKNACGHDSTQLCGC